MYIEIQAFSAGSIPRRVLDSIPEALKRGKRLVAYVIGQVGDSTPVDITSNNNNVKLSWTEKAIQAMANMARGVKLFLGHQKGTNDNTDRRSVGEVVASYIDNINGKLSAIAVAPFDGIPEEDVCSIEADIVAQPSGEKSFIVEAIKNLTGIAIARGEDEAPAFSGARRIATVQCFTPHQENTHRRAEMEITFKDAKDFVKEKMVFPSQMYTIDDILSDREFQGVLQQKFMNHGEVKEIKDKYNAAIEKLSQYEKKEGRVRGKQVLESKLQEATTDELKAHILRSFDKSDYADFTDAGIAKFISDETKEFEYLKETFGAPKNPGDGKSSDDLLREEQEKNEEQKAALDDIADELFGE